MFIGITGILHVHQHYQHSDVTQLSLLLL